MEWKNYWFDQDNQGSLKGDRLRGYEEGFLKQRTAKAVAFQHSREQREDCTGGGVKGGDSGIR